ncbi:hypothetical protein HELRODRAFT_186498 [Helobdella robusta]|uniref:Protein Wnt n=1 Tax=Helobdella robusta TaxID=6412 RepID=T1FP01_HELRO|nr:hypothetical protein HELRODRAFT_186498 [Helobdella robusta]ESN99004.1 hypothetical protein HELRODRAFT_186498 [Helobdella robusta]
MNLGIEQQRISRDMIACEKFQGFSSQQRRMCFIYLDHMPALARGAYLALQECQHQFRDHRWNCTVANSSHIYSHFANLGTPEIGFVHSIMSAFIASSLARACKDGELTTCGCSRKDRPRSLPQDWLWEGCGDDVNYGRLFTEKFVKAHYDTNPSKSTREYLSQITERHNGEVGSRTAVMYARPVCKCHGVSGSCNVKTCWEEVAPIRELGDHLKAKYDEAIPVRPSKKMNIIRRKNKSSKKLTKSDIAYFNQPLDYCELNLKKGSFGTKGRFCNKTSSGTDGCSHMCCGRGFYSKKITVHEQCHCKFRWCCEVKCKVCEKIVDIHWCK